MDASLQPYTSLACEAQGEYIEKKSRFIGYAAPAQTEAQALAFLAKIRSKHADARHNVYAYRVAENNTTRYSDDGEPQGTAGLPVLDVLRKQNIQNAVVVVTRYFGGILLGAPGLVRAYTAAAVEAVRAAGVTEYRPFTFFTLRCGYTLYQKLLRDLPKFEARTQDSLFDADVTLRLSVESPRFLPFCDYLREISAGSVVCEEVSEELSAI